jgi:hypothetical protein
MKCGAPVVQNIFADLAVPMPALQRPPPNSLASLLKFAAAAVPAAGVLKTIDVDQQPRES